MPRITTEAATDKATQRLEELLAAAGTGSSVFDLCASCLDDLDGDGAPWPDTGDHPGSKLVPYSGERPLADEGVLIIASDVDHPDYDDTDYHCAICDVTLTEADDGTY